MKLAIIGLVLVGTIGGGWYYMRNKPAAGQTTGSAAPGGPGGPGGFGGPGGPMGRGFGGPRLPMTVELASVKRADMADHITVVGNLIGQATIETVPKVSGRIQSVSVRLGDSVRRGQVLAKIEDREVQEQVRQQQAANEVSEATVRQREASLRLAKNNLDRSHSLFERQLIPKQTFDDVESQYQAAAALLDLAKAQEQQTAARLDELKINLGNTVIVSPVNGFIGRRTLDPGAWVTTNSPFLSVVDISLVRMVANVVEKDLRRISTGHAANVSVDAFPGEEFLGHVARIAPVLDPATRTAQIEVEIDNPKFRLKPGMYARVDFTVEKRDNTLVVPANALVDVQNTRGVFQAAPGGIAKFHPITVGLIDEKHVEVTAGLVEGDKIVTTGAAALREGDKIVLAGQGPDSPAGNGGPAGRGRGPGRGGQRGAEAGSGAGPRGGSSQS